VLVVVSLTICPTYAQVHTLGQLSSQHSYYYPDDYPCCLSFLKKWTHRPGAELSVAAAARGPVLEGFFNLLQMCWRVIYDETGQSCSDILKTHRIFKKLEDVSYLKPAISALRSARNIAIILDKHTCWSDEALDSAQSSGHGCQLRCRVQGRGIK
jgi:hypothetical protein